MRKLLVLSLILTGFTVFGQQQALPLPIFIVTPAMGTDTIKYGLDTVRLAEDVISQMNESATDTNYTVVFTPKENCGQLSLCKITRFYFIVKQQQGALPKAVFDYVLFAKQSRPWMPMPHRRTEPAPQGH